jgi:3-phenylpropionate/trans-cinnamate dioxygenase ferredoxin reductase subunit
MGFAEVPYRVVIIGAGQAGAEAAFRLRQLGFKGDIALVGEEPQAPYQRPPLSKAYLKGELPLERLLLRDHEVYAQDHIALLVDTKAVSIDRSRRVVALSNGEDLPYDALILATGGRPRQLPLHGSNLKGVHLFRSVSDADALRPAMRQGASLVVIGAGFIGLEAAAVARQLSLTVTVIETAERPLMRVAGADVGRFFQEEHVRQGVRFMCRTQPVSIDGSGKAEAVTLADGTSISADIVIIGIGVAPETALAEASGLEVTNGVMTDDMCRTSDPRIFAIGDCAARPMIHYGARCARLESVHNAIEGAKVAAAAITGHAAHPVEAPWFWSDQYDLKLQIAGLFQGHDRVVLRGSPESRSFAAFYYMNDRLIAVDAINRPAEFLAAKLLIQSGRTIAAELVVDEAKPMKALMASAAQ